MNIYWLFLIIVFSLVFPIIFLSGFLETLYLMIAAVVIWIFAVLLLSRLKRIHECQRAGKSEELYHMLKQLSIFYNINYTNFCEMYSFSKISSPKEFLSKMEQGRDSGYFRSNTKKSIQSKRMVIYWLYSKMEEMAYYITYGLQTFDLFVEERKMDSTRIERSEQWLLRQKKKPGYSLVKNAFDFYLNRDFQNVYDNLKKYSKICFGDNKAILLVLMYVCALKLDYNIKDDISSEGLNLLECALKNEEFKQFVLREIKK